MAESFFSTLSPTQLTLVSNTIRMLAVDAVEKANSGHPGMPMGMAEIASVLWLKYLRVQPQTPRWINRDRFVLSNGHGCMLLYGMLHLSGYDLALEDLMKFRQWESKTPGHPEFHITPGVDATTGPLGQGISNAVGMAIGQKLLAQKFNSDQFRPIDHRVFAFAGDGCLQEGISHESCSLAGHLGLGNLILVYDDNHISIAGSTDLSWSDDVTKRFDAYGWHTQRVDGHDIPALDKALDLAVLEGNRPSLIAARTIIGRGSPDKANNSEVHGSPLGKEELQKTKEALGWPLEPSFYVPDEVKEIFAKRREEWDRFYKEWDEKFGKWKSSNYEKAAELQAHLDLTVPSDLRSRLIDALPKKPAPTATRKLSSEVLQAASAAVPALIGGSADLEPSTFTLINGSPDIQRGQFAGKNLRFGIREHGMGAVMNGLAYYGGFIPYGSTFLCFADYMRPTLRLAAVSELPGLFIFTHDSIFLGEDGPTHQPIEHLQSLRLIPNLHVMRPADGLETAVCYGVALARRNGPCALILSRQNIDPIERSTDFDPSEIASGAYRAYGEKSDPDLVLVGTGAECGLAIQAAKLLEKETKVRVVSMPCYELFLQQTEFYREQLIPKRSRKVVIEAGRTAGWTEMVGGTQADTLAIGIDRFGASAPAKVLAEKFGLTPGAVVDRVREKFLR